MTTELGSPFTTATGGRRTLRIAVVNGSPSEKSKTMGLVDVMVQTLAGRLAEERVATAA